LTSFLEKVLGPGGVEQALEVYPIPYLWNRGN
jgi:hypothetical protein